MIGLALAYFVFALLVLVLRYAVLPQIDSYRPELERLLGDSLHRPVSIRQIEAYWSGLHPALILNGLEIRDQQGRSALGLEQVEAELAWDSLLFMQLRLARLEIVAPDLVLRRDAAGKLFVAGLEIDTNNGAGGDDGFVDWLEAQHSVVIRDASLSWIDEKRGAPALELRRVNFRLDNRFNRHRFGLTAEPPTELAARLDLRGDFKSRDLERLDAWKGELYADLDYADLAVWQRWIDYPASLPQGRGGLRLWVGIADGELRTLTADVRLADVLLQLRPELPELDLTMLQGRIAAKRQRDGGEIRLQHISLRSRDGGELPPADITLTWREAQGKRPPSGSLSASGLDIGSVTALASHLPIDEALRGRLAGHRPGGRIDGLALTWIRPPGAPPQWTLKARFDALRFDALGQVPGASGLAGRVEGSDKGGVIELDGRQVTLMLPQVFEVAEVALDRLSAEIAWLATAQGPDITLKQVQFENDDAAGRLNGHWKPAANDPEGKGFIDLSASLSRGKGEAVWRYMPLVVGADARHWLQKNLRGGRASDVTLRLLGELRHFPFRQGTAAHADGGGVFRVHGRFSDGLLEYADGWPGLSAVEGELLFEGPRMLITGKRSKLLGATVSNVKAEIADLGLPATVLEVAGTANGPTNEFLGFIAASPVSEHIDHFTAGMRAEGRGELDLRLELPLTRIDQSRVEGRYRFDNNRLHLHEDVPPLSEVRGQLRFTGDGVEARGLRARVLDSPVGVDIRSGKGGRIDIAAEGEIGIAALRNRYPSPVFDHLSGTARWSGAIRIQKPAFDVALISNLVGISSSLPAPFNKSATEALTLRIGRTGVPENRRGETPKVGAGGTAHTDLLGVELGRVLSAQLVRRIDGADVAIQRGSLALGGSNLPLPKSGIEVAGALSSLDADAWRATLAGFGNGGNNGWTTRLPPVRFDLHADEVALFDKNFRNIRIQGQHQGTLTRFALKSPDLSGQFAWDTAGSGRIDGSIGELAIPESLSQPDTLDKEVGNLVEKLPALNIDIGKLSFKGRELGSVKLMAENRDSFWNARFKLDASETQLDGTLKWRPDPTRSETRLEFGLDTRSIEKMLGRLGHPDGIRRGTAGLKGNLAWRGPPVAIDYPSLTGSVSANAASGQFTKLEPGVGRLLGVLSLQSLPRRITLDFRDVFSEGFAFDQIRGNFDVRQGVMHTKDLEIQGPAAKVLMNGSIDLGAETQNLTVRVQPALGETIAVGAMIAANPVAGAVAWVAQKLLKDPLDQVFAFEYSVTGHWQDPKVDKLGQTSTPAAPAGAEEKK